MATSLNCLSIAIGEPESSTSSKVGGNISTLPMWSGWLSETATYLMSDGLMPPCSSWPASVFCRLQCVARGSAGF